MKSLFLKTLSLSLIVSAAFFAAPEADAQMNRRGEEWVVCAAEDGYCSVNGYSEVAYGAGNSFVYRTMSGSFRCSNDVFGDPAYRVRKACYVRVERGGWDRDDRGGYGRDRDDRGYGRGRGDHGGYGRGRGGRGDYGHDRGDRGGQWQYCAQENKTCYVGGRAEVRYGANGRFTTLSANGSIQCDNRTFGDPIVGTPKYCEFRLR